RLTKPLATHGRTIHWVIHVILAVDRILPAYPDEQTFSESEGNSQTGHFRTHAPQHHSVKSSDVNERAFPPRAVTAIPHGRQEVPMSTNEVRSNDAARNAGVAGIDMKLEVVVIPVSDVERSKEFYEGIGWRLDIDRSAGEDFRLVQFTPPGSGCSVHFGKN